MDEKIIKARLAAEAASGLVSNKVLPHEVYEGKKRAREIVDAAQAEAKAILERAALDAAALSETARREGYEEGLLQWNEALLEAERAREALCRESERQIVAVGLKVAEKIIGERIREQPATIVSIVAEALKTVRRERDLVIQVNPSHVEELRQRVDRLQALAGGSRTVRVVAAENIAPGGCIIESELGKIDAQLETQLRCFERALRRAAGE